MRLPWVLAGGCLLTLLAAALNASMVVLTGTSVSHLTGDLARFSIGLGEHTAESLQLAIRLAAALLGFVAGALLSGWFIHQPSFELSRPYGRSITAIGGLHLAAFLILSWSPDGALFLASCACGFQNALATHYRGVILRTTHVTGLLTDLGVALGMALRRHPPRPGSISVPSLLILCFAMGSLLGGVLALNFGEMTILSIALLYLAGGMSWSFVKRLLRRLDKLPLEGLRRS